MKVRIGAAALVLSILACADLAGPRALTLALSVVPVFDGNGLFADNADQLRIRLQRDSLGTLITIKDTTVSVDASGEVNADLNVVLVQSPQVFRVLLDAIRSSDGAILFSGVQSVSVTSGATSTAQNVQVPVFYAGPRGTRVVLTPADTVVSANATFTFKSTVFDADNVALGTPVGYYLINPADANKLTVNRISGVATSGTVSGDVLILALSADSLRDTAHVFVGGLPTSVRITPGFGNIAAAGSLQLAGVVLDGAGAPMAGQAVTWASRNAARATVSGSGLVTGVSAGTGVIVATSGSLGDSILIAVPGPNGLVINATADGRSFRSAKVNDNVVMEFAADLGNAGGDKLASYNARFTWDVTKMTYTAAVAAAAGDFPAPVVNTDSVTAGVLRFAQVSPSGKNGVFTLAKFQFKAVAQGQANSALAITEASAPAPALTNLLSRVTVANAAVAIRP